MVIKKVENKLEKLVEGTFARFFSSAIKPVEISRRIVREIERNRSIGVNGETLAPNEFNVVISQADFKNFASASEAIQRELEETIRDYCYQEAYGFLGSVNVTLNTDEHLRNGTLQIDAQFTQNETGNPPGSLVLPDGQRVPLGSSTTSIGRLQESTICIDDPSISRNQAKIHLGESGYLLSDLGSTNGTLVNGFRITDHWLVDHDQIEFGKYKVRFEAS